jgi:hypothetical protein
MAQITMTNPAPANAHLDPNHPDAEAANCPNQSFVARVCTSRGDLFISKLQILKPRHHYSKSGGHFYSTADTKKRAKPMTTR